MADFAPPDGPPPPKVPEGWKAVWNAQYKEWFFVNTYTKKSQWDKPTSPVYPPPSDDAPPGAPPGYDHSTSKPVRPEKGGLGSNNPYNSGSAGGAGSSGVDEDERLARQLQAEEDERAKARGSDRGASDTYYQGETSGTPSYGQQSAPYGQQQSSPYGQSSSPATQDQDRGKKGGLFSKLTSKLGSSSKPSQGYGQYGGQQGYGGYPPQQGYGMGYPPQQQYGGGYGAPGYPQQGYYPQGGGYAQQPPRKSGGLGAGGGALLGAGAGLVGGALLMDAIDDHEDYEQQQAYDQGYDNGGGGDDYGGDDGGGGDF